jgi:hypothetical protein
LKRKIVQRKFTQILVLKKRIRMQKSKARRINLRIATEEDGQIIYTSTIDPCSDEIILVKTRDENGKVCETNKELEDDIEEVLNHEVLHIMLKRVKNYMVSCAMDEISGWCKTPEGKDKIIFLSKKDRRKLAKLVKEKKKPILKGIIEQLPD